MGKFEKKEIKSSSSCKSEALLSEVLGDIHNRFGVSKCVLEKIGHMKQERKVVDGEVMIESKFDDAAILKDIQKWKKIRVSLVDTYFNKVFLLGYALIILKPAVLRNVKSLALHFWDTL